ncbi:MAG: hypothetical protein JWL82_537 [Parcubacteria group bacterium]|nr:hypothetical protein [Parcubacteria group bacterium]
MLVRIGTFIALLLLAGYGAFKAYPLISGPEVTLASPRDGQTFTDGFVRVEGVSSRTEDLSLDGAPLLIDEAGRFSTVFVLPHGGAILSLTATDRFGKTETVRRTIFVP